MSPKVPAPAPKSEARKPAPPRPGWLARFFARPAEYNLRLPPAAFAAGFAVFAGWVLYNWWDRYPMEIELFAAYWDRDAHYLLPKLGGFLGNWALNGAVIAAVAGFEASSWWVGARCLAFALGPRGGGLGDTVLSLGLGNGMLGTAVLAMGLSGLLHPALLWCLYLVPLAPAVLAMRAASPRLVAFRDGVREGMRSFGFIEWSLLLFTAFIAVTNWLPALEPEWFYDSLVYHLAVPEQYLIEHKVWYLSHTFFSNFPFLQEMQYMLLLVVSNEMAGKVLHCTDGVLAAVAVYCLARPFMSRRAALLAAAVSMSQPTMRFLSHVTMVELKVTLFQVLSVMAFFRAMRWLKPEAPRGAWLLVAGWFMGFAQGTKYLGLFSSAIVLGWFVTEGVAARRSVGRWLAGREARWLLAAVLWASLWTGSWLGKNWLFTGDPVFPMMRNAFPPLHWDQRCYDRWMFDNKKYGTGHGSPLDWIKRPLEPETRTEMLSWLNMPVDASTDVSLFGTFTLNPFALLFIPVLFLVRGMPPGIRFLGGYSGVYFVVWAVSSQQTRFLHPMIAPGAVAIAWVVSQAGRNSPAAGGAIRIAAFWVLLNSVYGQFHNRQTNNALVPFVTGYLDRGAILRMGVNYYEAAEKASSTVAPGNRLLFVGGDESFYFRCRRIAPSIYDRAFIGELAKVSSGPDDLLRRLRRRKVTHMLVHEPRAEEYVHYGVFEWGDRARDNFLGMWKAYGRLVDVRHGIFLFDLTGGPLPPSERKSGMPSYFYPSKVVARCQELLKKADAYFAKGAATESYKATDEMVKLMPGATHVYSYRAYANSLLKRYKAAIADYESAVRNGYPTAVVYYNLALLLEDDKKYERSLTMHLKALELEPRIGKARERVVAMALLLKRYQLALRYAEELQVETPKDLELMQEVERIRKLVGGARARVGLP